MPARLCREISGMMARFWCGFKDNDRRIQWCSWEKMGKAKVDGGHGFRKLESFNKVLLANQCWRLLTNPTSQVEVF